MNSSLENVYLYPSKPTSSTDISITIDACPQASKIFKYQIICSLLYMTIYMNVYWKRTYMAYLQNLSSQNNC